MAIDLDVHGNTKPLEAAVQAAINRIRRQPIKITVDDKGATQPLGNMKRAADEFSKSMEAANARILAFGASMAIINGVADAFKGMVRNLVEVEKSLADINVVMGLSTQNLDKFGDGLFKVAKETGAAFRVAADAATEYARQGLAVEETLKRTRDALVLTRLTGMDSAEAVKSLTAAMNTYGNQIKDTTQLVSKFAAVDVQFAVSAEDFAAAISRTGQAAKSAGVDIDELIGIVTSAQQQTARGGAVIGNALKTIFTKTGRTDTLNQLENLGIAVRDLEGNTIGAKRILSDLANTFDTLSEAQKAQITQTMGGLFHINILKAVLSDAAKQNGILANATQISANATDEAIQKNEQLRKTMDAMASETGNAIKQLSVQIGELMLAPGMEKILNTVKSLAEGASDILGDGEGAGNKFANGFLKGLGNVITGPGLVVLTTVFVKLFMTAAKFTKESLSSLIGVTSEAQKQKAIQTSLVALIGQNAALGKEMLRTDISRTEKEKILLGLLQMQTAEANKLNAISKQLASTLYTRGYGPGLTTGKRRAYGHIPNFADPERSQAARGGYAAGSIRTMNMPGEGSVIYNSAETVKNFAGFKQPAIMPPQSSKAGKNYQQAFGSIHGFDPYAAGGYIPNFKKIKPRTSALTAKQGRIQYGINQNSSDYIGLAASRGSDQIGNYYYVVPGTGDSGVYQARADGSPPKGFTDIHSPTKGKKTASPGQGKGAKVSFDFYTLDESDKKRGSKRFEDQISEKLQNKGFEVTNQILNSLSLDKSFAMDRSNINSDLPKSKMAVVSGHIFEAVAKSIIRGVGEADKITQDQIARIDLPKNKELYKLFGVPGSKGRKGAEAKINTNTKNAKLFARKIYDVRFGKSGAPNLSHTSDLKKGILSSKNGALTVMVEGKERAFNSNDPDQIKALKDAKFIPSTKEGRFSKKSLEKQLKSAAGGYIPNFAAMAISRLGGLGKSKFGLAAVINSNPYFAQLLRRYGHWKNFPPQEKAKLNKFLLKQGFTNRTLQGYGLASMHSKSIGEGISNIAAAGGYIPNFADPLSDAIGREKAAGVPVSQIRVGSHSALMSKGNPLGLGVTNTYDEPNGLRDVFGANGFVPNYAVGDFMGSVFGKKNENVKYLDKEIKDLRKNINSYKKQINSLERGSIQLNDAQMRLELEEEQLASAINLREEEIKKSGKRQGGLVGKYSAASKWFEGTGVGRSLAGGGGMGLMIGAPMLAGLLQGGGAAKGGFGYAAGGALTGAATGASMGMMLGPLGIAVGGAVGAITGWIGALNESKEAIKKEKEERIKTQKQSMSQGFLSIAQGEELTSRLSSTKLSQQNLKDIGLTGSDTVAEGLRKAFGIMGLSQKQAPSISELASQGKSVDQGLEDYFLKAQRGTEYLTEKQVAQSMTELQERARFYKSRKGYKEGMNIDEIETFLARQGPLGAFSKTIENVRKSQQFQEQAKAQIGAGPQQVGTSKEVRNKLIDYLIENEKGPFSFNFGEGKGGLLDNLSKEKYSKILKGQKIKIGEQEFQADEAAIQANLSEEVTRIEKEYLDKKTAQKNAIILQLNLQKAQIQAQKAASDAQFSIKSKFLDQSRLLDSQEKLLSGLMSEEQKVRIKYNKSLLKASEAYKSGAAKAESELKIGIMQDIGQNVSLQDALKRELFKGEDPSGKNLMDLTSKMASMEYKELEKILMRIGLSDQKANEILTNRGLIYQNQLDTLRQQKDLTDKTSKIDRDLNMRLAERKSLMEDINREMQNYNRSLQYAAESRAIQSEITSAKFGSGPARTREEIVAEERRLSGERQQGFIDQYVDLANSKNEKIVEAALKRESAEKTFREQGGQARVSDLETYLGTQDMIAPSEDVLALQQELESLQALQQSINDAKKEEDKLLQDASDELKYQVKLTQEKIDKEKELQKIREDEYARKTGPNAFSEGMKGARIEMGKQVKMMDYELGQKIPFAFADGMANAMTEALNGTKNIKDALTDAAISFLGMIQKAMMQKAAYSIVGAMGFSRGGNVRNYSRGGGVPAMVSNGEYVMGRDAVAKYGGSFMHSLNAGGRIPGFSEGGEASKRQISVAGKGSSIMLRKSLEAKQNQEAKLRNAVEEHLIAKGTIRRESDYAGPGEAGSALAANFGGGRGFKSGRQYQRRAMSGFFYAQSGNVGLGEDTSAMGSILQEEERIKQEAEARRQAKKAKRRQLIGSLVGIVAGAAISKFASGFGSSGSKILAEKGIPSGSVDYLVKNNPGMSQVHAEMLLSNAKNGLPGVDLNHYIPAGSPYSAGDLLGPPRYYGGPIRKYASGGYISGKSGIDQIPAMLSEGEYVIRASSARQLGKPMLDRINAGKFNEGGAVSELMGSSETASSGGNTNNINISINMERGSGSKKENQSQDNSGQNPADRSSDEQNNAQLAERIKQQVVAVIVEEQRPGGLLSE